jgi:hypothetical protein
MEYRFRDIEKKWQEWWKANKVYKVSNDSAKPKYYVLDMFPYPSGAGFACGTSVGIYRIGYLCTVQAAERVLMYYTRWDMMHLVCRLNNMRSNMGYILQFLLRTTLIISASS